MRLAGLISSKNFRRIIAYEMGCVGGGWIDGGGCMSQGQKVRCSLFCGVWVVTHVLAGGLYEIRRGDESTHVYGRFLQVSV